MGNLICVGREDLDDTEDRVRKNSKVGRLLYVTMGSYQ